MPVAGALDKGLVSFPTVAWEKNRHLPRGAAAILAALRFRDPEPDLLHRLSDTEWTNALDYADRAGLTLILGATCGEHLPAWVRERIDRNLAGNTERLARLRSSLAEIAACLARCRVDYLLLKGFSHQAGYVADPRLRMAWDIDLFTPRDSFIAGRDAICAMGYEPTRDAEARVNFHLSPLLRKNEWRWRGDFFDPETPVPVDFHFDFWDSSTERIQVDGTDDFWNRRVTEDGIPLLHPVDRLGYTALHLLRHVLRGSTRPYHVYELAYFLEHHCEHQEFWDQWRALHPEPMRGLEVIGFRLAVYWFGCRLAALPREDIYQLDESVAWWFDRYASAPAEAPFRPNKDELWLHFALLNSGRERRRLFLRRAFPTNRPRETAATLMTDEKAAWHARAQSRIKYAAHAAERVFHHARALPSTLAHGAVWKFRSLDVGAPFWHFLVASCLFNIGLFLFYVLYNLYLLDRGYRENVLGVIVSAFTVGNLAGVLPAAGFARRFGLKRTVVLCFLGTSAVFALRSLVSGEPGLLAAAFAGGLLFSIWAVCVSPVVAALTTERARPVGFSLIFGSGIATGVLFGAIGGHLPGWLLRFGLATTAAGAKQFVLLVAAAAPIFALLPLARLRIESPQARETRSYPRGSFITRFLIAIGIWNFATGLFNPLFNAYFARQFAMPAARIGTAVSLAQAAQVLAILSAPLALRKLGMVRGVAGMQFATALAIASLASCSAASAAIALYAIYASLQYMSEPGIYSLLMDRVAPGERSGASALNFLVLFLAQAAAGWTSGIIITRMGYSSMLAGAACLAAAAGIAFWRLLGRFGAS